MRIAVPPSKLAIRFARSGGPGGQNVNKVETKVEIRIHLDDLDVSGAVRARIAANLGRRVDPEGRVTVVASRFRLRSRNLRDGIERLEALLSQAAEPPKPRVATKPTRSSRDRRRADKRRRSLQKRQRAERPHAD